MEHTGLTLLEGTYSLESCQLERQDGRVEHPYGRDPAGLLVYSPSGHFSGHVVRLGMPRFKDGARRAAPAEVKQAFLGYIGYFGTYRIDAATGTVTHLVSGGWHPNWIGTEQLRHFRISGSRLLLETPWLGAGTGARRIRLVWRRVGRWR